MSSPGFSQQSLQFERDHQRTQNLLSRYMEIRQTSGDAEVMYPDIAAHLQVCRVCRGLYDDLSAVESEPQDDQVSLRSMVLNQLAYDPPLPAIPQTPVDMLSREEIVLRVGHVISEAEDDDPAAGHLLFYDTLLVGKLNLVALFTLHRSDNPGLFRIEGVITPEQPAVRYKAVLWQGKSTLEAHAEGGHLTFDAVSIAPETAQLFVTLAVHTRWQSGR